MSTSSFDWLNAAVRAGPMVTTVYAVLALCVYSVGFLAHGHSAFQAWRDRRVALQSEEADEGMRIVADARWWGTFYRWLVMGFLVALGILGLSAGNPEALPLGLRRAIGLVLVALVVGVWTNAERIYWRQKAKLAHRVAADVSLRKSVPAHEQAWATHVRVKLMIPEHEPRGHDRYASEFEAAKRKMHELDVPCWRCGVRKSDLDRDGAGLITEANPHGAKQLEAHHTTVEFSLAEGIDPAAFARDYPEFNISDADSFMRWLESEGNLLALCDVCHRSPDMGIHGGLSYPLWQVERWWKKSLPPLVEGDG